MWRVPTTIVTHTSPDARSLIASEGREDPAIAGALDELARRGWTRRADTGDDGEWRVAAFDRKQQGIRSVRAHEAGPARAFGPPGRIARTMALTGCPAKEVR